MDTLELTVEAPAPERREHECAQATDAGWIDPAVAWQPRWVLLLGAEPEAETSE